MQHGKRLDKLAWIPLLLEVINKYDVLEIALFIIDTKLNEHCRLVNGMI